MQKKLLSSLLYVLPVVAFSQDGTDALISNGFHTLLNGGNIPKYTENYLLNAADEYIENKLSENTPNIEISIKGVASLKPTIGIMSVKPLYESDTLQDTVFLQTSLFSANGKHTVNIGSGYRYMTMDHAWLFGANIFFDQEFPKNHQRSSIGLEARSSILEFNFNKYYALTGFKPGTNNLNEIVLGGKDLEIGIQLPYMPGSRIYYKNFEWDGVNGASNLSGSTSSISLSGSFLLNGLYLDVGKTNYEGRQGKEFIQITYKYPPDKKRGIRFFSDEIYEFSTMKDKRLEKVRRENLLIKQQSGRGTIIFR